MKKTGSFLCQLFIIIITTNLYAQNKQDSLFAVLKKAKHDTIKINTYYNLAVHYQTVDLLKSKLFVDSAFRIAEKGKYSNHIAKLQSQYGRIYYIRGNYTEALVNYLEAFKYSELTNNKTGILSSKTNIGNIYYIQKNFTKALEYYQTAYKFIEQNENTNPELSKYKQSVINNIGSVYENMNQDEKAFKYYRQAVVFAGINPDDPNCGNTYNNIGKLFLKNKMNDSALYYLNKALAFRIKINDKIGICRSYKNIGAYYLETHNFVNAIDFLSKALSLTDSTGEINPKEEIYALLSDAYEHTNNTAQALFYQKKLAEIKDSIYNARINNEVMRLEMKYELEKKEEQLKIERQKKEFRYVILASVLFSLLIVMGLLYFLARSKTKRIFLERKNLELENQKLELEKDSLTKELEYKNKELVTNVMYLFKKNEFITNLAEKLIKNQQFFNKEAKDIVQSIIKELETNVDETVWNEFEIRFQQVHTKFYERLNEAYPDLTPNEKKICAFLKLNMSTKDISAITFQAPKSIMNARSRLRKKMNMERDENLIAYLQQL